MQEVTYESLFALFVSLFHYNVDDFQRLTPVEAGIILETKRELDDSKYAFYQSEFRLQNWFIIKSSMGDTKEIQNPSDLYSFPWENDHKQKRQQEFFSRDLTTEEKRLIQSM